MADCLCARRGRVPHRMAHTCRGRALVHAGAAGPAAAGLVGFTCGAALPRLWFDWYHTVHGMPGVKAVNAVCTGMWLVAGGSALLTQWKIWNSLLWCIVACLSPHPFRPDELLAHPLCCPRPVLVPAITGVVSLETVASANTHASASWGRSSALFRGLGVRMGMATGGWVRTLADGLHGSMTSGVLLRCDLHVRWGTPPWPVAVLQAGDCQHTKRWLLLLPAGVPSVIREHPVTRRMAYTGTCLRLATAICDAGAGGGCLLDPLTFRGIHAQLDSLDLLSKDVSTITGATGCVFLH